MNMFLKVMLSFALCYVVGVLSAFAEIRNHHIFYRQDTRAPLTRIDIVFLGAGRNQDQPSQIGLARTVWRMIWDAAKRRGYMDQLSALGTRFSTSTSTSYQRISISALSKNCGESIKIVVDLIQNLEFSDLDLKEAKKQLATRYQNDLRSQPSTYMNNFALSQTTSLKKLRSLKTLKNLSLEDIRQYYDQLMKTEVVFFKVISDLNSTEVAKLIRPITDERETGGFVHSLAHLKTDTKVGPVAFVFNSNIKSVFSYWLIPFGNLGEETYVPALIAQALRGDIRGLIPKYFREELGLTYGPSCRLRTSGEVRYLEIFADPQLHNSEELIQKMSDFIRELSDNPRFWEALKERREILKLSDVHNQTPQRSLNREVSRAIYNIPRRKGGYDSVTDEEIRSFIEKFFVSENMVMIFRGPKDNIKDILNTHWPKAEVHEPSRQSLIE
ncbi:MAG: insulinase family protein [Gemmatimonadetes bacterium]|nr:insulinase family protein [Gemmatimonadota bacterium]